MPNEAKYCVNVEVPNSIEMSSLKEVKYVEVRGVSGEVG